MVLDDKDLGILDVLRQNSKLTTQRISKKLNIPITTVHNRIKRMEKLGIIKGYTTILDYKKLGKPIQAYVLVSALSSMPNGRKIYQEDVAKEIKKIKGVEEVDVMTGVTDLLVRARVRDIDELNDFLIKKLRKIDGVDKTQTMIVLSSA